MTPRALAEDITGSSYYTKPSCDLIADVDLAWPKDGSFDNSLLSGLHEFIDPPNPMDPSDWDYEYQYTVECLGVWDTVGRKVCQTNQMISNCPKTVLVIVHKINDIDYPVPDQFSQPGADSSCRS